MPKRRSYGSGTVQRRGNSWRVRIMVDGQRHTYSLRDVTKKEAERFAKDKAQELRDLTGLGLPGRIRFSALLTRYEAEALSQRAPQTVKSYQSTLAAFRTFFIRDSGDPLAAEIRRGHVKAFLSWRRLHQPDGSTRSRPLSSRSVEKDRAILSGVFSFAEELEVVAANPCRKVAVPKGDKREPLIIDDGQFDALVEACGDRDMLRLYVLVLGEAGLRCDSEALWLRFEDVDLENGFLTVESVRKGRRTKSGRMRVVPMTPRLLEAMRAHFRSYRFAAYDGGASPWLFHHLVTRRHAKAGDRITKLRKSFYAAAKRAELPADLRQHDLRHRRVTTWLAAGKPAHLVQKAMGHSDIRVTLGYSHLVPEDLRTLVDPLPEGPQTGRQLRRVEPSR